MLYIYKTPVRPYVFAIMTVKRIVYLIRFDYLCENNGDN